MVKVDDLWIGDVLVVKHSGRVGTFVGVAPDGRLRIQSEGKIFRVRASALELMNEKPVHSALEKLNIDLKTYQKEQESTERIIDLHIEKLMPHLSQALPERIITIQVQAFEDFMNKAKQQKLPFVTIIHGRGQGVLRSHIHSYLKTDDGVKNFYLTNNDGATEVELS